MIDNIKNVLIMIMFIIVGVLGIIYIHEMGHYNKFIEGGYEIKEVCYIGFGVSEENVTKFAWVETIEKYKNDEDRLWHQQWDSDWKLFGWFD